MKASKQLKQLNNYPLKLGCGYKDEISLTLNNAIQSHNLTITMRFLGLMLYSSNYHNHHFSNYHNYIE